MRKTIQLLMSVVFLVSCGDKKQSQENETIVLSKRPYVEEDLKVKAITISKADFNNELVSNGKLAAMRKAEIPFEHTAYIKKVHVSNGDRVEAGALLAELEQDEAFDKLKQAKLNMEKSEIDLKDMLLGYGHKISDTAKVPANILRYCKIKSNYVNAASDLKAAEKKYELTNLRAPFSGVIANLEAMPDNLTTTYKNVLCALIDNSRMKVEFALLESELKLIRKGLKIEVFPFSNPDQGYKGVIDEINPIINEDGMVTVKATIANTSGALFDGMNVKVLVKNKVANKLVVPKSAVLQRQNKKVVFTYQEGEALWNYVETGSENSSEVVIEKGLDEGARVIVAGNINLAHKSKVELE